MAFLSELRSFSGSLKNVETLVTSPSGDKHIERRTKEGVPVVETTLATKGAGYCIDSTEDVTVGVAIDGKLLVSSVCVAHNKALLKELGVTHVLNVAAGLSNAFPEDFVCLHVDMYDDDQEVLMSHYKKCEAFIDEALDSNGVVLVHCYSGASRSVSIAALYVMHRYGASDVEALLKIRSMRPQANPNPSFKRQLKDVCDQLKNGFETS